MIDRDTFNKDPRLFAWALVNEGMVDGTEMFNWLLDWCSQDDIRRFLEANDIALDYWFGDDEEDDEDMD